jgi:hypothetical protein
VRGGGGGRLHGQDTDDLAVEHQRLGVGGTDAEFGDLPVGTPAAVGAGDDGLAVGDHGGQEGGLVQRDGGQQPRVLDGGFAPVGDGLAEGHDHRRRRLVDPDRQAGRAGGGPQAAEQVLHGCLGVVGGHRRLSPRRRSAGRRH